MHVPFQVVDDKPPTPLEIDDYCVCCVHINIYIGLSEKNFCETNVIFNSKYNCR